MSDYDDSLRLRADALQAAGPDEFPRGYYEAQAADEIEAEKPQWQKDLDAVFEPEGWEPPEEVTAMEFLVLAGAEPGKAAEALEDYYSRIADQILAERSEREATATVEQDAPDLSTIRPVPAPADAPLHLPDTLAGAYARGAEDMAEEMGRCCGCSGGILTNPYDGSQV